MYLFSMQGTCPASQGRSQQRFGHFQAVVEPLALSLGGFAPVDRILLCLPCPFECGSFHLSGQVNLADMIVRL